MTRIVLLVTTLFLLVSVAFAADRYADKRRHFSFPVPSGWTQVSPGDLKEIYEQINEGIDGLPVTLAAWEKNPSKRTSEPTLVLRWRKVRHDRATAEYERLKSDFGSMRAELLKDHEITKAYKVGTLTFDEKAAAVRIPYGFESLHTDDVKILAVRFLGQYGLIFMEFRGSKSAFDRCSKEIEATIAGFRWDRTFAVNYEAPPPAPAPPPPPPPAPESTSGRDPFDGPPPEDEFPIAPETILIIVVALLAIAGLALLVVRAGGGGRRPPPRRRGGEGGYRRR
jgi:hypothetical protein